MSYTVALTYDDGPDPLWTEQLLAELRESGARATFFVITPNAMKNRDLIEAMHADGHEVAGGQARGDRRHSPCTRCAATIGPTIEALLPLRELGLLDRLLVIEAESADGTGRIAATTGADVLPGNSLCVFLDADSHDFRADFLTGLLGPLLLEPGVELSKGTFERPLSLGASVRDGEGGGSPSSSPALCSICTSLPLPDSPSHWRARSRFVATSSPACGSRSAMESRLG